MVKVIIFKITLHDNESPYQNPRIIAGYPDTDILTASG